MPAAPAAVGLALLLAALAPPTPGGAEGVAFLTDPAGDVAYSLAGGAPVPAPAAVADAADLLALDVAQGEEALALTLAVKSLGSTSTGSVYNVDFAWATEDYRVTIAYYPAFDGSAGAEFAYLERLDGSAEDEDYETVSDIPLEVDPAKGTFAVTLPKVLVLDANGRMPGMGDTLTNVRATGRACCDIRVNGGGLAARDTMPDSGTGPGLEILHGDLATGNVRLGADDRVRVSNGGATTFVFRASVINAGEKDDEFALGAMDVPDGWNVTVQSPVRVPAGESKEIAVLASVPFAHEHGGFDAFNLTAASTTDAASTARMRLGVLHTPIPQPAGHHPDLFLHAKNGETSTIGSVFATLFPFSYGYMNTESTPEPDDVPHVNAAYFNGDGTAWMIPLSPSLAMGLDFDLARTGLLEGALSSGESGEGQISAALYLYSEADGGDVALLAESDPTTATLDPNAPTPFKLTLVPTEEADFIPYARGQNLYLEITLRSTGAGSCAILGTTCYLYADGFRLSLPLNEYHDPIDAASEATGDALQLVAKSDLARAGRPGTTLAYAFTLTNPGDEDETVVLSVAGTDAALGTLAPDGVLTLGAGESRDVTLGVDIPAEAGEGDTLEVLVFAHSEEDPSRAAIARTVTRVALGEDAAPDESDVLRTAQADAERGTPGASALLTLASAAAAAAALARAGRKRRA